MMVALVISLLGLLIIGFLVAPLWMQRNRTAFSPEQIERISREIEEEIRALRTYPGEQA
jgi:hypothetical protein